MKIIINNNKQLMKRKKLNKMYKVKIIIFKKQPLTSEKIKNYYFQ